jgi:3',5'-cyclic AMP phosphodiesterase CpdA
VLIAQLSDPHLCAPGTLYQGLIDSNAMFEAAIRRLATLDPAPDLVLLTGDVTEHATIEEYRLARQLLAGIRQPLLAIPGNHDEREAFRAAFGDLGYLPATGPLHFVASAHGPVRVVGLDISAPGTTTASSTRRRRLGWSRRWRVSRSGRRSSCCTSRRSKPASASSIPIAA